MKAIHPVVMCRLWDVSSMLRPAKEHQTNVNWSDSCDHVNLGPTRHRDVVVVVQLTIEFVVNNLERARITVRLPHLTGHNRSACIRLTAGGRECHEVGNRHKPTTMNIMSISPMRSGHSTFAPTCLESHLTDRCPNMLLKNDMTRSTEPGRPTPLI